MANTKIDINILSSQMGLQFEDNGNGFLDTGDKCKTGNFLGEKFASYYEMVSDDFKSLTNLQSKLTELTEGRAHIALAYDSKNKTTYVASASETDGSYLRLYKVNDGIDDKLISEGNAVVFNGASDSMISYRREWGPQIGSGGLGAKNSGLGGGGTAEGLGGLGTHGRGTGGCGYGTGGYFASDQKGGACENFSSPLPPGPCDGGKVTNRELCLATIDEVEKEKSSYQSEKAEKEKFDVLENDAKDKLDQHLSDMQQAIIVGSFSVALIVQYFEYKSVADKYAQQSKDHSAQCIDHKQKYTDLEGSYTLSVKHFIHECD